MSGQSKSLIRQLMRRMASPYIETWKPLHFVWNLNTALQYLAYYNNLITFVMLF